MEILDIQKELKGNSYPGRGIIIGKSEDGKNAVIAYFIMGRSVNSRNRIFEEIDGGDGIRTNAVDPSKISDPSLVIYNPVRKFEYKTIVTNGDQTDTILDFLKGGGTFEEALRTRTFEPDEPNFTPRISGVLNLHDRGFNYKLSILKTLNGNPGMALRQFFEYEPTDGIGHFIHTYKEDGDPRIPSFEGEPKMVKIEGDLISFSRNVWESLNDDNKVALFTRFINLETGEFESKIINKYK